MKKILMLIACVAMVSGLSAQNDGGVQNFVEVVGESTIKVAPNNFKLSVTIDDAATKGRNSVAEVETEMIEALKNIGVDTKSKLRINDMSSAALRNKDLMVRVSYTLELRSKEMVAKSVNTLKSLGITSVELRSATNDQVEEYRGRARVEAVANARAKAQQLGEALGQQVGECLQLVDNANSYIPDMMYMARSNSESMSMNVDYDDIKISHRVEAKFLLVVGSETKREVIK